MFFFKHCMQVVFGLISFCFQSQVKIRIWLKISQMFKIPVWIRLIQFPNTLLQFILKEKAIVWRWNGTVFYSQWRVHLFFCYGYISVVLRWKKKNRADRTGFKIVGFLLLGFWLFRIFKTIYRIFSHSVFYFVALLYQDLLHFSLFSFFRIEKCSKLAWTLQFL